MASRCWKKKTSQKLIDNRDFGEEKYVKYSWIIIQLGKEINIPS
jgi:hypothetical protein